MKVNNNIRQFKRLNCVFSRAGPRLIQETFNDINSNKIWLSASVIDPPILLSHQYVIFPNTPCGSYSIMSIKLKTLKYLKDPGCLCGYMSSDLDEFQVHFEICGDSREIIVEPICGDLVSGNVSRLWVAQVGF